jgi:hypothetical protein
MDPCILPPINAGSETLICPFMRIGLPSLDSSKTGAGTSSALSVLASVCVDHGTGRGLQSEWKHELVAIALHRLSIRTIDFCGICHRRPRHVPASLVGDWARLPITFGVVRTPEVHPTIETLLSA